MNKIFFDASKLPDLKNEYVCWLDVMGTRSIMSSSLKRSANFICKLHIAALDSKHDDLRIYPLLDGAYITSEDQKPLLDFLEAVFYRIAEDFLAQEEHFHKFVIKAAVAYGPILHGADISDQVSRELNNHQEHRNALLLGIPVIQAYQSERKAPPFGIFVHESARSFAPADDKPLPHVWWKWFRQDNNSKRLYEAMTNYYAWCRKNSHTLLYEQDRLKEHEEMAKEYLAFEQETALPAQ